MRCYQLCWVILAIVFVVQNVQRCAVYGMPVDRVDGSNLCSLNFRPMSAKGEGFRIAFEILYREKTSVIANSSDCNLEFWNDATRLDMPAGNKRSIEYLEVRLTSENPELFKIYIDKAAQGWFHSKVNSIKRIVCSNRKFNCIRFPSADEGGSPVRRRLLSIDQLYMYKDPDDNIPLKPLILVLTGAVILVIAGSLCANCNKTKDDESISEARPQLVSCQQRLSQHKFSPEEQQVQEEIVFESTDVVVMETVEKIEGDSVEANNHQPLTTISHYEAPPISVRHEAPRSTQPHVSTHPPLPPSSAHPPVSPTSTGPGPQSNGQPVQANNTHPGPEAEEQTKRGSKSGSTKKKRGSEHEHEEHKGKFWKRTRSSKGRTADMTSGGGIKDEELKADRRSRKESKEQKVKSGKTKGRTGSTDSDKDEKNAVHDEHAERAREATPTLERHARGLPPPPATSVPALPVRPIPQRQISAPDGVEEDNNYETVETRKTKSLERVVASRAPADGDYDAVQVRVGKPRLPSLESGTSARKTSDIYEAVEDTSETVEYLYAEVPEAGNEKGKKTDVKNEEMTGDKIEDLEDPYARIKYGQVQEATENSEPYDNVEDPHSRMKYQKQQEATENSGLYEDVEKGQESQDKKHKYAAVNKGEVSRLLNEIEEDTEESNRKRSQSAAVVQQRSENDLPKRPNTIHVIRSAGEVTQKEGEVTWAPFDYTYAEVDLSMKSRQRRKTEGDETTEVEPWVSENPPPLPPAYVSSRQIQIEMGRNADSSMDAADNLYDEVATAIVRQQPPNMALLTPEDDSKRLSSVSDDYEVVEPIMKPAKPVVNTANDEYSEVVNLGPRSPKAGSGRAGPVHVEVCGAPANISVTVSSSSEQALQDGDNDYEQVALPKNNRGDAKVSVVGWV